MTSNQAETGVFWVDDPEVAEVLDLDSGEFLRHDQAIGTDYETVIQLRSELQTSIHKESPKYACSLCHAPVYLVSLAEKRRFFFRHTLEDGRCPARTRGTLSQDEIDARRYNGVKESRAHIQMKEWVAESLRADPNFSGVEIEKRWPGSASTEWRKPDVRAEFKGQPVVFEIQLSTTYLNVITARRDFYQREGALLLWVFATFHMESRRLIQDDVFFNNNRNAFVASSATRDASLETGSCVLECIWATPQLTGVPPLQRNQVRFEWLTLEPERQRIYFYDFEGERQALQAKAEAAELAQQASLKERFEAWFFAYLEGGANLDTWSELRRDFAAERVVLPEQPFRLPRGLLSALYSAKFGRVVGWAFPVFVQVAHRVEGGYPRHLRCFRHALQVYKRADQIRQEDKSGKWRAKVKVYTPLLDANDSRYEPDKSHDRLIRLLFPEMAPLPWD